MTTVVTGLFEQMGGGLVLFACKRSSWASPTEARRRTISAALRAIDLEREAFDDRAKKLEGRQPQ